MSQRKIDLPAPRVWVTRPNGSQGALIASLKTAGFEVHYEAMITIEPLHDAAQCARYSEQLARLNTQDGIIFISANAVESFIDIASQAQLQALQTQTVYAVGKATAAKLSAVGVAAIYPETQMSSEGLLALPALAQVSGQRFFVIRGVGGRGFLQQQLQLRGAVVTHVELYCRQAPGTLSETAQRLVQTKAIDAIFAGSVETFENLLSFAPNLDQQIVFVTPSARVSARVREAGLLRIAQAASASDADMIKTLQQYLAQ